MSVANSGSNGSFVLLTLRVRLQRPDPHAEREEYDIGKSWILGVMPTLVVGMFY